MGRIGENGVLAQVDSQPRTLSALLCAALDHSPAAAHLVALLALHSFSPALESQLRAGDEAPCCLRETPNDASVRRASA